MKYLIASLVVFCASTTAFAAETNAVSCERKAKELYRALDKAGDLMGTPQEYWTSADIDYIFDVLEKYRNKNVPAVAK